MSYQVLTSQADDLIATHEEPPHGNGVHSHFATTAATSSKIRPAHSQAVNYVHTSDVGDIIGTVYHIDTDKPAAYGRFDSQEEQDQAPNVYLSAKTISAEIRLSGSKKAKIEIQGSTANIYGRTMIRIVDDAKPSANGTPSPPTHFSINISATWVASSVVAVPTSFSGSISGACSLTGSIRDEAVCLVADAKKSRWTVRQDYDINPSSSTNSQPHYPPVSGPRETAKAPSLGEVAEPASDVPEHSLVTFTLLEVAGLGDKSGEEQRARRHVVYDCDFGLGQEKLEMVENKHRNWVRKFLLYYLLSCLGWTIFVYSMTAYLEGPTEAFFAFTIMPLAVSVIGPVIVIGEVWTMYHYKPPSIGSV